MFKNLISLSASKHQHMHWIPAEDYSFVANQQFLPLCKRELTQAAAHLPVLIRKGEPQVMTSLIPDENHYIDQKGQCRAGYVPLVLKTYPFAKVRDSKTGNYVLCIDEQAVSYSGSRPLLTEEGGIAPGVRKIMLQIERMEKERESLRQACALLEEHGLLQPRPMKIRISGRQEQTIKGLKRVNAKALKNLDKNQAASLYAQGALELAYAQIISMHHIQKLNNWAKNWYKQNKEKEKLASEISPDLDDDLLLDFSQFEDG